MRRQWAESQGKEEAAQAATQARIALLERELAALKCKETREWLAAEEACANWQTPPAECKVISLVGASPAQMRSLAAEQGVAEVDRSRMLSSSAASAPPTCSHPQAPRRRRRRRRRLAPMAMPPPKPLGIAIPRGRANHRRRRQ